MKFTPGNPTSRARSGSGLDSTDLEILELLQTNCKQPLATIGAEVGLSAPAVVERIHKLEDSGVIQGYSALIDARCVGLDVTAFIGLSTDGASGIKEVEAEVLEVPEVLECHHVTGVVLSSPIERTSVGLQVEGEPPPRPARRGSPRPRKRQARG
jgi:DNA-binding Lrp family transcriptional regulator